MNNAFSRTKQSLLTLKRNLLDDIESIEREKEKLSSVATNIYSTNCPEGSSDSDSEFTFTWKNGTHFRTLKTEKTSLLTHISCIEELNDINILQYEVNVLVGAPTLKREPPILEDGTWYEVNADCQFDRVLFGISFYQHKPKSQFAQFQYRGVRVRLVKDAHDRELASSVLHSVKRPSDALEVLHAYASAHRSRRRTLAHIADKYGDLLQMELQDDGGCLVKFSNMFQVSWNLQNKWSPLTPFYHSMKFDFEYMDEVYLRQIKLAHKELINPIIDTDERTNLLLAIMSVCLEAKGQVDSETMSESDHETIKNKELETKDREVMAPPKSLPKKTKRKTTTTGNSVFVSKSVKRVSDNTLKSTSKRVKTMNNDSNSRQNEAMAPLPKKTKSKGKENKVELRKSVSKVSENEDELSKTAETTEIKTNNVLTEQMKQSERVNIKKVNNEQISGDNTVDRDKNALKVGKQVNKEKVAGNNKVGQDKSAPKVSKKVNNEQVVNDNTTGRDKNSPRVTKKVNKDQVASDNTAGQKKYPIENKQVNKEHFASVNTVQNDKCASNVTGKVKNDEAARTTEPKTKKLLAEQNDKVKKKNSSKQLQHGGETKSLPKTNKKVSENVNVASKKDKFTENRITLAEQNGHENGKKLYTDRVSDKNLTAAKSKLTCKGDSKSSTAQQLTKITKGNDNENNTLKNNPKVNSETVRNKTKKLIPVSSENLTEKSKQNNLIDNREYKQKKQLPVKNKFNIFQPRLQNEENNIEKSHKKQTRVNNIKIFNKPHQNSNETTNFKVIKSSVTNSSRIPKAIN